MAFVFDVSSDGCLAELHRNTLYEDIKSQVSIRADNKNGGESTRNPILRGSLTNGKDSGATLDTHDSLTKTSKRNSRDKSSNNRSSSSSYISRWKNSSTPMSTVKGGLFSCCAKRHPSPDAIGNEVFFRSELQVGENGNLVTVVEQGRESADNTWKMRPSATTYHYKVNVLRCIYSTSL